MLLADNMTRIYQYYSLRLTNLSLNKIERVKVEWSVLVQASLMNVGRNLVCLEKMGLLQQIISTGEK